MTTFAERYAISGNITFVHDGDEISGHLFDVIMHNEHEGEEIYHINCWSREDAENAAAAIDIFYSPRVRKCDGAHYVDISVPFFAEATA